MTNEFRLAKIIWAIDPFDESEEEHESVLQLLTRLHEKTGAEVLPVSIVGPVEGLLPNTTLLTDPGFLPKAQDAAERNLEDLFPVGGPEWLHPPRLIMHSADTLSEAVDGFILEAQRESADLIVTRSHGRQGLPRLLNGSFAETLVDRSPQPVLVLGGHASTPQFFDHVLFPTDFGERSRTSFRWIIEWAKTQGAKVTLFHALSPPEDIGLDFDAPDRLIEYQGENLTFRQLVERQAERQMRRAAAWAERAANEGVAADFMIDDTGADLEDLVRHFTRRAQCDLVVMESHDHPLRTAWLGSRTRDVLRSAECPVLILPAHFLQDWARRPGAMPEMTPPL